MKRFRILAVFLLACLVLLTGCEKVKKLFSTAEKAKPPPSAVPELQIIGVPEEEQVALRDLLVVRGLLRQAQDYVVVINTQIVRKGEALVLDVEDKTYHLEILSVNVDRVVVQAITEPGKQ